MRLRKIKAPGKSVGAKGLYPWRELKVGGMFEIVGITRTAAGSAAVMAGKLTGRKFSTRKRDGTTDCFVVRRVK